MIRLFPRNRSRAKLTVLALLVGTAGLSVVVAMLADVSYGLMVAQLGSLGCLSFLIVVRTRGMMVLEEKHTRTVRRDVADLYTQIEALHGLHLTLGLSEPLPPMRDWAVSPDFGLLLVSTIRELRPRTIVEASSGVSSVICGICLEELGGAGRVVSLDHEEEYARRSREALRLHGVEGVVSVEHAPLVDHVLEGETYRWYDTTAVDRLESIDLLVIDGPPGYLGRLIRYPALPLLVGRLSPNAVVLLDDAARAAEREIVDRWVAECPDFRARYVYTEKGAVVLSRISGPTSPAAGPRR